MRAAPAVVAVLLMLPVGASLGPGAAPAAGSFVRPAQTPLFVNFWANYSDSSPNATITLNLESFLWGQPANLDNLTITHEATGALVANARVAPGRYEAGFVMPSLPDGAFGTTVSFWANATLDGTSVSSRVSVSSQRSFLTLTRLDNGSRDAWGWGLFDPGDTIRFEVEETDSGHPANLGIPNITVEVEDGYATLDDDPLAGPIAPARVGVGTYRFELAVPADLVATRRYLVQATLKAPLSEGSYMDQLAGTERARVRHTPVASYVSNATNESANITVLVGDADPIPGARVLVSAPLRSSPIRPDPMVIVLDQTTGPWGTVQAHIEFPEHWSSPLRLDVVEGAFTSTWTVWNPPPSLPPPTAEDRVPPPTGFVAYATPLDPPAVDVLRVRVQVFQDGEPLANTSLAHLAFRDSVPLHGPMETGNVTTDAEGAFLMDLRPPAWWPWDSGYVYLWNATGVRTTAGYDSRVPYRGNAFLPVHVQGTAVGEPIHITVDASALTPHAQGQVLGEASVYPAESLLDPLNYPYYVDSFTNYGGRPPNVGLWPNASVQGTVNGTAMVPYWWPAGEYVVMAFAYMFPADGDSPFWWLMNTTQIHLAPTTREPPPPPEPELVGTSETFIPGAGPAVVVLALVGAAAAPRVAARRLGR